MTTTVGASTGAERQQQSSAARVNIDSDAISDDIDVVLSADNVDTTALVESGGEVPRAVQLVLWRHVGVEKGYPARTRGSAAIPVIETRRRKRSNANVNANATAVADGAFVFGSASGFALEQMVAAVQDVASCARVSHAWRWAAADVLIWASERMKVLRRRGREHAFGSIPSPVSSVFVAASDGVGRSQAGDWERRSQSRATVKSSALVASPAHSPNVLRATVDFAEIAPFDGTHSTTTLMPREPARKLRQAKKEASLVDLPQLTFDEELNMRRTADSSTSEIDSNLDSESSSPDPVLDATPTSRLRAIAKNPIRTKVNSPSDDPLRAKRNSGGDRPLDVFSTTNSIKKVAVAEKQSSTSAKCVGPESKLSRAKRTLQKYPTVADFRSRRDVPGHNSAPSPPSSDKISKALRAAIRTFVKSLGVGEPDALFGGGAAQSSRSVDNMTSSSTPSLTPDQCRQRLAIFEKELQREVYRRYKQTSQRQVVLEELRSFLFTNLLAAIVDSPYARDHDSTLSTRLASLAWLQPRHLEMDDALAVDSHIQTAWQSASQQLGAINDVASPQGKLTTVYAASMTLMDALGAVDLANTSADDFLPHLIMVLLRANPPLLQSNIQFVSQFVSPDSLFGAEYYFFTTLVSAASFLAILDHTHLSGVTALEFQRLCEMDSVLGPDVKDTNGTLSTTQLLNSPPSPSMSDTSVASYSSPSRKMTSQLARHRALLFGEAAPMDFQKDDERTKASSALRSSVDRGVSRLSVALAGIKPTAINVGLHTLHREFPFLGIHDPSDLSPQDVRDLLLGYKALALRVLGDFGRSRTLSASVADMVESNAVVFADDSHTDHALPRLRSHTQQADGAGKAQPAGALVLKVRHAGDSEALFRFVSVFPVTLSNLRAAIQVRFETFSVGRIFLLGTDNSKAEVALETDGDILFLTNHAFLEFQ